MYRRQQDDLHDWNVYHKVNGPKKGRRKDFFNGGGGVDLNVTFQKCSFCTDLFTNNLYKKCIIFAPRRPSPSYAPDKPS